VRRKADEAEAELRGGDDGEGRRQKAAERGTKTAPDPAPQTQTRHNVGTELLLFAPASGGPAGHGSPTETSPIFPTDPAAASQTGPEKALLSASIR
jgi:hypothetical protein